MLFALQTAETVTGIWQCFPGNYTLIANASQVLSWYRTNILHVLI